MFMVECDGAVLPVLVHGNVESGVFLIRVHGGPGGYSIASQYTQMDSEEFDWDTSIWNYSPDWGRDIALVDFDQRGAGTAQGNALPEQFTLDQFVEDLDAVVDTVRHLYHPCALFMIGHSFGGLLAAAYLLDPTHQAKLNGWIEFAGGHDTRRGFALSRQFVIDYAQAEIAAGRDTAKWTEALAWYDRNPVITIDSISQHSYYVDQAYGYSPRMHVFDVAYTMRPEIIFSTPASTFAMLFNTGYSMKNFDVWNLSLSDEMAAITIPSLLVWGRHDGQVPPAMAEDAYEHLGTPVENKRILYLENSGHGVACEEDRTLFMAALEAFIAEYR
jgi:alpha-beta hydrolase superfamily lysophospholipase